VRNNPLLIVLGEPNSIFSEILFKAYKKKIIQKFNRPIVIIGSENLLKLQMKLLKYSIKIQKINTFGLKKSNLNKKYINIINVEYRFKKIFDKISSGSNKYINDCFKIALKLLNEKSAFALINGPVSKTHFLEKKYLGITEYLASKTKVKKKPTMLIYNSTFSVCPITTHLPINHVTKNLTKSKIVSDVMNINHFYKKKLNKRPKFAILGLNPHCESVEKFSEEKKIIKPAIKFLIRNKIDIKGPFSADTFFSKKNLFHYDIAVGMYHDQVLTPMKTIFGFNATNLTLGLPFLRVSPDHGTNNEMIGKNKSNAQSLISSINFFKKIR
jgi:4-hydroxythreonine-4-phosphate dehydrogenase|tara:strand:- start:1642 stop:2622 length:981 start_codon:yes stop_codon:yes gene_type:complete